MFKKAFWVPYEDSANYPTLAKTMEAISKYCEENGKSYTFINDDEVEINGKRYEIYRGYENGSRGNYGIKSVKITFLYHRQPKQCSACHRTGRGRCGTEKCRGLRRHRCRLSPACGMPAIPAR